MFPVVLGIAVVIFMLIVRRIARNRARDTTQELLAAATLRLDPGAARRHPLTPRPKRKPSATRDGEVLF